MPRLEPLRAVRRRSRGRALSAYWDAVVLRAPSDPVPPTDVDRALAATIRRLQAAPAPPRPSPSFADQLLDTVLQPRRGDRPMHATLTAHAVAQPARTTGDPPAPGNPVNARRSAHPRWNGLALAGLVAAVILAAIWTASPRGGAPPDRHRDTTALAAVGTPVATVQLGADAATPAPANQTVGIGNALFFTAAVDLSEAQGGAELWLTEVGAGGYLSPIGYAAHVVMPLSGSFRDQGSATSIEAGQAVSFPSMSPWSLENTSGSTVSVLVLSIGGEHPDTPDALAGPQPVVFSEDSPRVWNLGPIAFDPAREAALLEVRTSVGGGSRTQIDTGSDGIAVVLAEDTPAIVDVLAGDGALRRFGSDDGSGTPADPVRFAPDAAAPDTAYLAAGDVLTITGGAAAEVHGADEGTLPVLVVTLRFDSALLPAIQSGGVFVPASTNAAGTPVAPDGCGASRYTEDELRSLLATPAAAPLPALGLGLADGVPADPATVLAIEGAADRFAACVRTNDPVRYARLWTPDGLRLVYSVEDLEEDLAQEALPAERAGIVDATVQDVRVHDDGRVSAVVDIDGEVAYVVWVEVDGVYLVELFNDPLFAGELADGARCDAAPLRADELAAVVPATLTPAPFRGDGGLDITDPGPDGSTPAPVAPDAPGVEVATVAVGRLFDCLSTLDPARVAALATDGFRAQWLGVAPGLAPLAEPMSGPATRFPLTVPTVFAVEPWEENGTSYLGVGINGSTVAYLVLERVDGEWLVAGWAPL